MRTNNNHKLIERRKELRHNQADAELKLWGFLRNRQFYGLKFYRQFSIGPYIVDFYCSSKKLAIELDGSQHLEKENMGKDQERNEYLNHLGITVVRFMNNEVLGNGEGVMEKIGQVMNDY